MNMAKETNFSSAAILAYLTVEVKRLMASIKLLYRFCP